MQKWAHQFDEWPQTTQIPLKASVSASIILQLACRAAFPRMPYFHLPLFVFVLLFSANVTVWSHSETMFQFFKTKWLESSVYNLIRTKSSQISASTQIVCERMHVYTIATHQRITKAALPDSPVFSACEVLEILDVFSPFITPRGPRGLKIAMHISSNDMQREGFMGWRSPFSLLLYVHPF